MIGAGWKNTSSLTDASADKWNNVTHSLRLSVASYKAVRCHYPLYPLQFNFMENISPSTRAPLPIPWRLNIVTSLWLLLLCAQTAAVSEGARMEGGRCRAAAEGDGGVAPRCRPSQCRLPMVSRQTGLPLHRTYIGHSHSYVSCCCCCSSSFNWSPHLVGSARSVVLIRFTAARYRVIPDAGVARVHMKQYDFHHFTAPDELWCLYHHYDMSIVRTTEPLAHRISSEEWACQATQI